MSSHVGVSPHVRTFRPSTRSPTCGVGLTATRYFHGPRWLPRGPWRCPSTRTLGSTMWSTSFARSPKRLDDRRISDHMNRWGPDIRAGVRVAEHRNAFAGVEFLGGVTFDVAPGASAAILGPNGSGKSTVLRILAGVLSSDSGLAPIGDAPVGRGLASFIPAGDRM